ncbi:MAG: hypothetical protein RJB62_1732 [Pseudomonadota bacterium]|jgi:hypothetical protein
MTDEFGAQRAGEPPAQPPAEILREPFPVARLLYAILFAVIASVVFWVVIVIAVLQFVTVAINGEKNDELAQFSRRMSRYMQEMFDYIMLAQDERPFPLGPFPKE